MITKNVTYSGVYWSYLYCYRFGPRSGLAEVGGVHSDPASGVPAVFS